LVLEWGFRGRRI